MYRIIHEYSCIVYQNKLYHIFVTPISAYSVISKESKFNVTIFDENVYCFISYLYYISNLIMWCRHNYDSICKITSLVLCFLVARIWEIQFYHPNNILIKREWFPDVAFIRHDLRVPLNFRLCEVSHWSCGINLLCSFFEDPSVCSFLF
jgi:hypothetical protein